MKILLVLGPFDRFNYGDILFPLIIEECFKNKYDGIRFFSTSDNDLTNIGGVKCESFKELYNLDRSNTYHLIVAGGESLGTTWGTLSAYISRSFSLFSLSFKVIRLFFGQIVRFRVSNFCGRAYLGGKSFLPLSVSLSELPFIEKIFYNSLGGTNLSSEYFRSIPKLSQIYRDVSYLSVRELYTFSLLKSEGIAANLAPDCAILMSKYYTAQFFEENVRQEIKNIGEHKEGIIFFQVNEDLGSKYIDSIVLELHKLNEVTKYNICLCPIGIALGHSDHIILKKISSLLKFQHEFCKVENLTVWDIMYLISKSKLYIGTSLHGVITAMSYKVPYCGLENVKKVEYYLKTWGVKNLQTPLQFDNIANGAQSALNTSVGELSLSLNSQFSAIVNSFEKMQ